MLNTSTLSVSNEAKTDVPFIVIENPVRQNLVYKSKEKIGKIDIYSIDGELLKTVRENNSNISELQKGVYIAKTTFENGKF
jgi:hypothetical protein